MTLARAGTCHRISNSLGHLGLHSLHNSEEVSHGNTCSVSRHGVEVTVDLLLLFIRVFAVRLVRDTSGGSVLSKLGHEVLEFNNGKHAVTVGVGGGEGGGHLGHPFGLGLLVGKRISLGLNLSEVLSAEGISPGESLLSNHSVDHRVVF